MNTSVSTSTTTYPAKRWDDLFMIGFDKVWDNFMNSTSFPSFPFYNVIRSGDNEFNIEIALAGFGPDDIDIEERNSSLTISGTVDSDKRDYLHKGITTRSFSRTFALAEHVHVKSADMRNGILFINLIREVPESEKPRKIAILSATDLKKIEK